MSFVRIFGSGLLLAAVAVATAAHEPPTTVILVRHAEKVLDVDDPPLTAAGEERARELVHALGGLEIGAVFATPLRRTMATAGPLAAALGQEIAVTPVTPAYAADVARKVREEHAGGVVVVVSHSNTVPDVIRALGVAEAPEIPEDDYDNLFVVTLSDCSEPRLLSLRYGRESPAAR